MPQDVSFSVSLPPEVATALRQSAAERGWTPESLIGACVAQHLEVATRHRVLVERLEQVDAAILAMAQSVGELGADADAFEPGSLCRYRPVKGEASVP